MEGELDLHPYYVNSLFAKNFAWKFDLNFKYELLSKFCFPDLTAVELQTLLPNIEWDIIVKLSLFYTPIIESKGIFQPLSLYYRALKINFPQPEYFIEDMLEDQMELRNSVILSTIARIYNRTNIYDKIIKYAPHSDLIRSILYDEPLLSYDNNILTEVVNTLLDMVGISNLDICIILSSLPQVGVVKSIFDGLQGSVSDLYSLYGGILAYSDERIANLLEIEINRVSLEDKIRVHAVRLSPYLQLNILQYAPEDLLQDIYDNLNIKARNILGCYKPSLFTVVNTSSYFTSESYLQYCMNSKSLEVDDNSAYNDIGTLGYPL